MADYMAFSVLMRNTNNFYSVKL